jgi:hypothetical protein
MTSLVWMDINTCGGGNDDVKVKECDNAITKSGPSIIKDVTSCPIEVQGAEIDVSQVHKIIASIK